MRKIKVLIIVVLLCLLKINVVDAAECEKLTNIYASSVEDKFVYFLPAWLSYRDNNGEKREFHHQYYIFSDENNKNNIYLAYCRNAAKSTTSPGYEYGDELMSCKSAVFDTTEKADTTEKRAKLAYERGIIELLQDGPSARSNAALTDQRKYIVANNAMRAYEILWKGFDTNKHLYEAKLNTAMQYYANKLLEDEEVKALLKQIDEELESDSYTRKETFKTAATECSWSSTEMNTTDLEADIIKAAKDALNASIDYLKHGAPSIVWDKKTTQEVKDIGNVTEYKAIHTYDFKIENFNSTNSKIEMGFSCLDCYRYGMNYKLYINNEEVSLLTGTKKDFLKLDTIKNGSGTVTVKIEFSGDSKRYHEETINYNINLKYKDDTISTEAYVMQDATCLECQNFYMLYAKDVEKEKNINEKLIFTNKNNEMCTAYIENANCEDKEDNDIKISEGYKIDGSTCNNINQTNNEDIINCIINGKDPAGNSYQAVDLANNSYCNVWCKEDYHFTLPGIKEANSGRYFSLKATVNGTKTCYMSKKMDYQTFINKELEPQRELIIQKYYEWYNYKSMNTGTSNDQKLTTATKELNVEIQKFRNMLNAYNSCGGLTVTKYDNNNLVGSENQVGWEMDYDYNPHIKFWYEESYMNNVIKNELEANGSINQTKITETLYSSDNGKVPTNETTKEYDLQNYFICYATEDGFACGNKDFKVGTAKYVKQEITVEGKYVTPTQFYNIYPSGNIVVADKNKENDIENSSELTNSFPVGLGTRQGVYNYALRIENLGEYYDDPGNFGRLWGSKDSVVVKVLEEAEKADGNSCSEKGALTSSTNINNQPLKGGVYVCAYTVNCPEDECEVICDPNCKDSDCPENDCPVDCEGYHCIYTNNSTNINYRPISPGDINPNDRELGINWRYDENSISTGLELKAYATIKEIETAGESIYDINYEDISSTEEFSMQVTLTPSTINFIKNYNKQNESKGGYANNTLKCYDHKGNDGITYDNIYCYSTFLDELIEETGGPIASKNFGSDNVKIVGGKRYFDENDRKNQTSLSGYWTTWSQVNGTKWEITTTHEIDYYKQNYKEIGIGPSWK